MNKCKCVNACVNACVYVCVSMYISLHVHVCMYVYAYVRMCISGLLLFTNEYFLFLITCQGTTAHLRLDFILLFINVHCPVQINNACMYK